MTIVFGAKAGDYVTTQVTKYDDFSYTSSGSYDKTYTINASAGDVISFDYDYNKYYYGYYYVQLNGSTVVGSSSYEYKAESGTYKYVVPSDGTYTLYFYWYGYTSGYYCKTTNIQWQHRGVSDPYASASLSVNTQHGAFVDWTSTNHNHGSSSSKSYSITGKKDQQLTFDYEVSSESGCDWLTISIDGSQVVRVSGTGAGVKSHTYTFDSDKTIRLDVSYSKDGSVNNGSDIGRIFNISLSGEVIDYVDENGIQYALFDDGTASVVGGTEFEGDLEIPEKVNAGDSHEYTVTSIASSAFKNNANIFSVIIPSSVVYVSNEAFSGCESLMEVTCEDGSDLLWFGSDVFKESPLVFLYMGRDFKAVTPSAGPFYNSTSLADVEFGRDVTYIPDYGFYGCSGINEIKLLDGMKYVGANAFQGCTSLTDLIVGKNVAFLGANSFAGCTSLQGVEINATDADFMENAFNGDRSIATVNTPSVNDWLGIRFYNGTANPLAYAAALTVDSKSIASVTVPASFHKVSDFAFYNAGNIESVTFRNGVDTIGESAFYNCMNLESVSIPASIKLIDKNAFYGSSLSEVTIPENAGDYDIMSSAFRRIKTLSAAKLGGSLKVLGENAFQGDDNLEKVELAGTVKSIGLSAFANDVKLSDFTIADGADTVAFAATVFTGAPLATLYLGKSFTQPSSSSSTDNPFYNKTSIKTLTFGGPVKLIPAYSFCSCTGIDSLGFAEGAADVSMTIGNYAFEGCSAIKRVTFPGKLTSLGSYAFQNTTSLEEVAFNYGPQSAYIYNYNFYNDRKIANVTIGKSVTLESTSSNYAPFYGKTSIKNVTLRGAVTAIPTYLFYGCTGIQNLTIESGVASIGNYAFYNCYNIASLNIPNTVTNIGEEAFSYCI